MKPTTTTTTNKYIYLFHPVYDDPPVDPPVDPPKAKLGELSPEQQAAVDKIVQERVAKLKTENEKMIKQLNQIKQSKSLTDQEKEKLQQQIDDLEAASMTKAELATKAAKEQEKKNQEEIERLTGEATGWKSRYENSTIEREITDAAIRAEAFRPSQIVTLLHGNTKLVEVMEDGEPTGKFETRIKFGGRDSEGKPMVMDLTVEEAIQEMKKMNEEYGNLFKSGLVNGVGGNNVPGTGPLTSKVLSSQEAYMKQRDKIKETVR